MLTLQLAFELLDANRFSAILAILITGKCCRSVLKKLLLPTIENLRLELILVTQVRYCNVID